MDENNIKKLIKESNGATIVAATKTRSVEQINMLKNYGITIAGENRAGELLEKYEGAVGIDFHFIGRLQTNKVKYIIDKVKMIQSVDSIRLADEIQRQCVKHGISMDVLVQLSLGETQKGGAGKQDFFVLCRHIDSLDNLRLKGLMCVPPKAATDSHYMAAAAVYKEMKAEFDGIEFFSMGMSDDYKTALKNGANMIRPGSILFGKGRTENS